MKTIRNLLFCLVLLLAGCGSTGPSTVSPSSSPQPTAMSEGTKTEVTAGTYQMGVGMVSKVTTGTIPNSDATWARLETTVAFLVTNEEGIIQQVRLDAVSQPVSADEEGNITWPRETIEVPSKKQQGFSYEMGAASALRLEYFTQVQNFEDYCIGKNINEVLSLDLQFNSAGEKVATTQDLVTRCTIGISDFLVALEKAYEASIQVQDVYKIGVGLASKLPEPTWIDGETVDLETWVVAVAYNTSNQVTGFILNQGHTIAQNQGTWTEVTPEAVNPSSETEENTDIPWEQQQEALTQWARGKTPDALVNLGAKDGQFVEEGLVGICTFDPTEAQQALQEANQSLFTIWITEN